MVVSLTRSSRKILIASYIIGGIGAVGQAYLLHAELSTGHQYRLVAAGLYASIAEAGFWLSPLAAIGLTLAFARRSLFASVMLPATLSPAVFAFVFRFLSGTTGLSSLPEVPGSDFSAGAAASQFYMYSIGLIVAGIATAACVGVVLKAIQSARSMP